MKSEAEKKLIAAEIAANVHKKIAIEEARLFTKKYSREQLYVANSIFANSAAVEASYLMRKADYAKFATILQRYKEKLRGTS